MLDSNKIADLLTKVELTQGDISVAREHFNLVSQALDSNNPPEIAQVNIDRTGGYNVNKLLSIDSAFALTQALLKKVRYANGHSENSPLFLLRSSTKWLGKEDRIKYLEGDDLQNRVNSALLYARVVQRPAYFILEDHNHYTAVSVIPDKNTVNTFHLVYMNSVDKAYAMDSLREEVANQICTEQIANGKSDAEAKDYLQSENAKERLSDKNIQKLFAEGALGKAKLLNSGKKIFNSFKPYLESFSKMGYEIKTHEHHLPQQLIHNCSIAAACNIAGIEEMHIGAGYNYAAFQGNPGVDFINLKDEASIKSFVDPALDRFLARAGIAPQHNAARPDRALEDETEEKKVEEKKPRKLDFANAGEDELIDESRDAKQRRKPATNSDIPNNNKKGNANNNHDAPSDFNRLLAFIGQSIKHVPEYASNMSKQEMLMAAVGIAAIGLGINAYLGGTALTTLSTYLASAAIYLEPVIAPVIGFIDAYPTFSAVAGACGVAAACGAMR